jgi:hypothetical protein
VLNSYAQIWRWRDWIVRSLNADRPYDSMVRAMLAADELAPGDSEEVVATGFLVRNFYRWNYNSWMKDNVEHTGKAFLGLTFNCAHCHDHKYDPIRQVDYFALRAVFEPIEIKHDRVPGEPDPGDYPDYQYGAAYGPITSGLVRVYDRRLDAKTFLYTKGESRNVVPGLPPVEPGMPGFLGVEPYRAEPVALPDEVAFPGSREFVRREEIRRREAELAAAEMGLARTRQVLGMLKKAGGDVAGRELELEAAVARERWALAEVGAIRARIAADEERRRGESPAARALSEQAARAERWAAFKKACADLAAGERDREGAMTKSAEEAAKLDPQVEAARKAVESSRAELEKDGGAHTPLASTFPATSTGRRAALARWITSGRNPLTARVAANHLWAWHLGRPLVATTHDLGRNGAEPTHPRLLDWLASELVRPEAAPGEPWSMKRLHRLIVTSEAYRMASRGGGESPSSSVAADRENRTYWHFPARRLEAEEVRDAILAATGELDPAMGGADIDLGQGLATRRRSLYYTHHAEARMPFLETFDAPDACDAYKRTTSVVPQQALALVNNAFVLELSEGLAGRLAGEGGDFVGAAFEAVLSRGPRPAERGLAERFLADQARIIGSEGGIGEADAAALARRDLVHALFSHNDFLTVH